MSKTLTKQCSVLVLRNSTPDIVVKEFREYISSVCDAVIISVDISNINLIDACKITVLCSTELYIKRPNAKINWIVGAAPVEKYVSPMELGNSDYI